MLSLNKHTLTEHTKKSIIKNQIERFCLRPCVSCIIIQHQRFPRGFWVLLRDVAQAHKCVAWQSFGSRVAINVIYTNRGCMCVCTNFRMQNYLLWLAGLWSGIEVDARYKHGRRQENDGKTNLLKY